MNANIKLLQNLQTIWESIPSDGESDIECDDDEAIFEEVPYFDNEAAFEELPQIEEEGPTAKDKLFVRPLSYCIFMVFSLLHFPS